MANTSGHSKKVTMNAILFGSYCLGNIVAPNFFISSEAPNYPTGYNAIIAGSVIAVAALILYEIIVRVENHRKDKALRLDVDAALDIAELEEDQLDLTDKEKKHFRYIY